MEVKVLSVKDVANVLHISEKTAQKMFHQKYFPKIKGVGNRLLVEEQAFMKYIRNEEYQI